MLIDEPLFKRFKTPKSKFIPSENLLNSIDKTNQKLKEYRKFIFREFFFMFCTCVLVPCAIYFGGKFSGGIFANNQIPPAIFMPYIIFVGWIHIGRMWNASIDYTNFFKDNFIFQILKTIDENFKYTHEKVLYDDDELENIGIIMYDITDKEDFISGNYHGLNFEFAEFHYYANSANREGAVFSCEFYKDFKYDLKIINKKIWKQKIDFDKLDDTEFNKIFDVETTDKTETRFLLSFSFMERLCKINANENFGFVSAAFKNGKFYLFLENSKNLFEPSFFFAPSIAQAHYFRDEFLEILSVIDELNLTLNIYPKTVLKNQKFTR